MVLIAQIAALIAQHSQKQKRFFAKNTKKDHNAHLVLTKAVFCFTINLNMILRIKLK